jgi:hypothetical protein
MNKRADIFSLLIVVLVVFMASFGLVSFVYQQGNLDAAVVPSTSLLKLQDRLDVYELNERIFLTEKFCSGVKDLDVLKVDLSEKMVEYSKLFFEDGLYYNGQLISVDSVDTQVEKVNFLRTIYSLELGSDSLTVKRTGVIRKIELSASDMSKINFGMYASVNLDDEYVLNRIDVC